MREQDKKEELKTVSLGSSFEEIIRKQFFFADHSLFIESILESEEKIIISTLPRRWGKSLNLSMLQCFCASTVGNRATAELFKDLEISKHKQFVETHQGQYVVLALNFKDLNTNNLLDLKKNMGTLIRNSYHELLSQLPNDTDDSQKNKKILQDIEGNNYQSISLEESLDFLITYLNQQFNKPIILLIDEYDKPLNYALKTDPDVNEISKFMKAFFNKTLNNRNIKKAFLTGIVDFSLSDVFSDLKNIKASNIVNDALTHYYGFSTNEVKNIVEKCTGLTDKASFFKKIQIEYRGFSMDTLMRYNPWSVNACVIKDGFNSHWVETAPEDFIDSSFLNQHIDVRKKIIELLLDRTVDIDIDDSIPRINQKPNTESAFWKLLIYTGYVEAQRVEQGKLRLNIANLELKKFYINRLYEWLSSIPVNYVDCLQQLLKFRVNEATQILKDNPVNLDECYIGLMASLLTTPSPDYQINAKTLNNSEDKVITISPNQPGPNIELLFIKAEKILRVNRIISEKNIVSHSIPLTAPSKRPREKNRFEDDEDDNYRHRFKQ